MLLLISSLASAGVIAPAHHPIHPEVGLGLARADGADLTEWIVPVFGGHEHGFTVFGADVDELSIHVGLSGADAFQDGADLLFVTPGGDAIRYTDLLAWDADGRELPASMEPAPGGFRIVVDLVGATFPVTVDPLTSTPWVALRSAYGYSGYNVANAGDINGDGRSDVLVAAPYTSNGNSYEGRVSLFYGSALLTSFRGVDWSVECGVDDCAMGLGDHPLAGIGDVNGDGYDDFAIGVPNLTGVSAYTGAVAVYYGSAAGPVGPTWIGATASVTPGNFGGAVSGGVDVNGDGYDDLIVGASGSSYTSGGGGYYYAGTVEVFHGSASGISTTASSRFAGGLTYDYCGMSVVGLGDVNSDGYDEIAYSCAYDVYGTYGVLMPGKIVVVAGGPTGASTTYGSWTIIGTEEWESLGEELAAGDINVDGIPDLLAVSGYYPSSTSSGHTTAAFAFLGNGAGLDTTASWSTEGPAVSTYYGPSIAFVPDVNNDGWPEIAVGSPDDASNYGTVNLYYGAAGLPSTTPGWTWTSDRSAIAGVAVAGLGNAAGPGTSGDLAVGAPWWDSNSADGQPEGRVFVFRGAP